MRTEIKRMMTSPMFVLSLIVFFLCLQGYSIPSYYRQWISPYGAPPEYRESALTMTLGGIFFGGAILLMPFCAAMVTSPSQVDDMRSGIMEFYLVRSSFRQYIAQKLASAFLGGFLIGSIAFGLHAILWNLMAFPYDPITYPEHGGLFWPGTLFDQWAPICHGLIIYIEVMLGLGFTAGVWAVVGMATAVWIPDKLLAVTIPMCIYKLWSTGLSYYLFGFYLPDPSTLFNDAQTVSGDVAAFMAYFVVLICAVLSYSIGLRKKVQHG